MVAGYELCLFLGFAAVLILQHSSFFTICDEALGRRLSENKAQSGLGVPLAFYVEWCFITCFLFFDFPRGERRHHIFL